MYFDDDRPAPVANKWSTPSSFSIALLGNTPHVLKTRSVCSRYPQDATRWQLHSIAGDLGSAVTLRKSSVSCVGPNMV